MKKLLMFAASLLAWPLFSSCTEYGAYGRTGGFSSGYTASSYGYGHGYAPLRVGFIGTTYDRWSYDPYRRCYYDRSIGQYYNYGSRAYYRTAPRRYTSPRYPSGYSKGTRISCPSYLPRTSARSHLSSRYPASRYTPVLHGSSRTHDRSRNSYQSSQHETRRSSQSRSIKSAPVIRRESTSQPSRRIQSQRSETRPTRTQTIRTSPSNYKKVRSTSSPSIRQPSSSSSRSSSSIRQPSPSRSIPSIRQPIPTRSVMPSRSLSKARQRTR